MARRAIQGKVKPGPGYGKQLANAIETDGVLVATVDLSQLQRVVMTQMEEIRTYFKATDPTGHFHVSVFTDPSMDESHPQQVCFANHNGAAGELLHVVTVKVEPGVVPKAVSEKPISGEPGWRIRYSFKSFTPPTA
jgi:hypothetical protein